MRIAGRLEMSTCTCPESVPLESRRAGGPVRGPTTAVADRSAQGPCDPCPEPLQAVSGFYSEDMRP